MRHKKANSDVNFDHPDDASVAGEAVFSIPDDGWCAQASQLASPNFDARPPGTVIDLLVVHNISLPPGQFGEHYIEDLFLNQLDCDAHPYFDQLRGLRVSAHFLIRRDGRVIQFVSANERAWHAGVSCFRGRERCNDFSIGVELEGTDHLPFSDAQYSSLTYLANSLSHRYPLQAVTGHEQLAPGRKTDPGPFFDWARFEQLWSAVATLPAGAQSLQFPHRPRADLSND